jgi:hypothetical protein
MSNFKDEILEAANGEPIIAIVIEGKEWYYSVKLRPNSTSVSGKVITWEEAAMLLDYEYSQEYGGVDCNAITAWTETRVIFVGCYDGSSWLTSVLRNPTPHIPEWVGGG